MSDYDWHVHFLRMAELVSQRSKDPSTKVGAVIVDPKTRSVVSTGYNGFPRGVDDDPARYNDRPVKYELVAHAEVNALLQAKRSVEGFSLYVIPTLMVPSCCPNCAKYVVQAGIKQLYFWEPLKVEDRWETMAKFTKILFNEGGVDCFAVPRGDNQPALTSVRHPDFEAMRA